MRERKRERVTTNEANVKIFVNLMKCIAEFFVLFNNLIAYKRDKKRNKEKSRKQKLIR